MRTLFASLAAAVGLTLAAAPGNAATPDRQAPSVPVLSGVGRTTITTSAHFAWAASDDTGVTSYDLRRRTATAGTLLGGYEALVDATPTAVHTLKGQPGSTWCLSVRARDAAGNVSSWSTERCTTFALDETAGSARGFRKLTSPSYTNRHAFHTTKRGATLTLPSTAVRRVAILTSTCATCGSVSVTIGNRTFPAVSLRSVPARSQVVKPLVDLATPRTGKVVVTVTTAGKDVLLDGVSLSPPAVSGSLVVDDGAVFSRSRSVTLTTSATGGAGALTQRLAEGTSVTGSAWEPFSDTRPWTLSPGDGPKTLSTQVRDAGGVVSPLAKTSIILDTTAPGVTTDAPAVSDGRTAPVVTASVVDTYGISEVLLHWREEGSTDEPMTTPMAASETGWEASPVVPESGNLAYWVSATDVAGNTHTTSPEVITIDRGATPGSTEVDAAVGPASALVAWSPLRSS